MGKRQLGELDVGELVSTLLISEIVAIPIDDPDIPLLNAIIPTLFIISIEIIISTLKNKSEKLKNTIEGVPSYIIYKGRLSQKALLENRISINELLAELRTQGIGDISEVEYGIIEQGGQLSIIKKDASPLFHPDHLFRHFLTIKSIQCRNHGCGQFLFDIHNLSAYIQLTCKDSGFL